MKEDAITFRVNPDELKAVEKLKEEQDVTWRELFLKPLGIDTKRRVGGPQRSSLK